MAAGFTVARDRLDEFAAFVEARVAGAGERAGPSLGLDGALSAAAATPELLALLADAGPWGAGNPEPRFAIAGCRVAHAAVVGNGHVRCRLAGEGGGNLQAIAFAAADRPVGAALLAAEGRPLHVAGHLRENHWRGRVSAQMVIDDVAPATSGMSERAA